MPEHQHHHHHPQHEHIHASVAASSEMPHAHHHEMMIGDFKKRFFVSLILTFPVLALSPMIQELFHFHLLLPANSYILFALSSIIYFFGGWPFLKGFYKEIIAKNPGMMTLIAVAVSVAYFYSSAVVFGVAGKEFFWELVTLIDIMLLGHWLEMKSILGASRALEYLVKMLPQTAHLIRQKEKQAANENTNIVDIQLKDLKSGDLILVKPGEKIPADGEIIDGASYLNESMLTGESKPQKRTIGERVIGGSINGNGVLKVKIQKTGKDTYLAKVINLVKTAQQSKSKTQKLADRAARWLTLIAITVGIVTLIAWLNLGSSAVFALERMVTVMVICCPHALGLAIPLVAAISTTRAAQQGLLIRNRTAFENARKITTLVFDKTGTLTKGSFNVTKCESLNSAYAKEDVLRYAASIEQNSEHPIALGIIKAAKEQNISWANIKIENSQALPGKGITAEIIEHSEGEGRGDGKSEGEGKTKQIAAVGQNYLQEKKILLPPLLKQLLSDITATIVTILINEEIIGVIALSDEIREESYNAIKTFKENNIKTIMLTGDNQEIAKAVSDELKIDAFYAGILPHQKLEIIKKLQEQGEFIAMTGDGINDAPALAQADIGIAIGSGTDIAAETADIILVASNPKDIVSLILSGKAAYRKMIQNLIWATGYNAITVPLAAGVLAAYGIILSPAVGAVLMSLSTIIVAINAQLLRLKTHF